MHEIPQTFREMLSRHKTKKWGFRGERSTCCSCGLFCVSCSSSMLLPSPAPALPCVTSSSSMLHTDSGQFLAGPTAAAPQTSLLSPCPYPCFTACVIFHRSHAHKPRRSVLDGSPHLGPSHDGGKASLTASPYTVHAHMVLIRMASPSRMPSSKHLSDAQCQAVRHATSKHAAGQTWHTPTRPQHAANPQDPQAKGAAPSRLLR